MGTASSRELAFMWLYPRCLPHPLRADNWEHDDSSTLVTSMAYGDRPPGLHWAQDFAYIHLLPSVPQASPQLRGQPGVPHGTCLRPAQFIEQTRPSWLSG